MLFYICYIKFDNILANCFPLHYIMTGQFKQDQCECYTEQTQQDIESIVSFIILAMQHVY